MTTADQEREAPAPCPFCGDAAFYHAIEPHEHHMSFGGLPPLPPSTGSHVIECCSCNAGMIADSKAEVFASWDRRTPSQPAAVKESLTVAQPAPAVPAGWPTIDSAPRDGTWILIARPEWDKAVVAKWGEYPGNPVISAGGGDTWMYGWVFRDPHLFAGGEEDGFLGWQEDADAMPTHWCHWTPTAPTPTQATA